MANHNPAEQPQGIDTVSIPHSGQLEGPMQELPTRRFDKTLLEEAHEQNLITIPDSPPADPEMEQKSSKNKAVIGGIAAAAAITAGAAGFAMGNSGGESNDTPSDNQASPEAVQGGQVDNILDTPPTETTITVEEGQASENIDEEAGIENSRVDLYNVNLGEDYIIATRPNGEEVHVPRLREGSPNEQASIAMSLMACYLTTGNEGCLDAFSENEEVRQHLINWRETDLVRMFENPANIDAQIVFMDTEADPVNFRAYTAAGGRQAIELESGTLYVGRAVNNFGSNEWQHPDFKDFGALEETVTSLKFVFEKTESGELKVVGLSDRYIPTS